MKLESVWTGLVYVFNILTFSASDDHDASQAPLEKIDFEVIYNNAPDAATIPHDKIAPDFSSEDYDATRSYVMDDGTPVVGVPKNGQEGVGPGLECEYPTMKEWKPCYGPNNRKCWLTRKDGTKTINIDTDYEDPQEVPTGITRKVRSTGVVQEEVAMLTALPVLSRYF
jgi:hypothetical protein